MSEATEPINSDDRPLKLLGRTPVDEAHKERLLHLVRVAQQAGVDAGEELQSEFGKTHVSMIVGCNQFVRLFRDESGAVEMLLPDDAKAALAEAGFTLQEPEGQLFKMFGWVRFDPMEGDLDVLERSLQAAFEKARG